MDSSSKLSSTGFSSSSTGSSSPNMMIINPRDTTPVLNRHNGLLVSEMLYSTNSLSPNHSRYHPYLNAQYISSHHTPFDVNHSVYESNHSQPISIYNSLASQTSSPIELPPAIYHPDKHSELMVF